MAIPNYGVNHPSAVKHWSHEVFKEALKRTHAIKFMGKTSASLCQIRSETKGMGDRITTHLRTQLAGAGISGDATLEGNEESLAIYTDSVYIDQLRHAVRAGGRMSEQRVPFESRDEAKDGLADWWADRIDRAFFNQLSGNTAEADTRYTGMQACLAPTNNVLITSDTAGSTVSLSTVDVMTLTHIDYAVENAKLATLPIRPIKLMGDDYYVCFMHEYQATDLRTNTSTGQWLDIQKAAMSGGEITKNPIFSGALGVYNKTILHSTSRLPTNLTTAAGANTGARAILCGAQAASIAFGKGNGPNKMTWVEELFDFENQLGVAAGLIWGLKKNVYNSADFGVINIPTYAIAH